MRNSLCGKLNEWSDLLHVALEKLTCVSKSRRENFFLFSFVISLCVGICFRNPMKYCFGKILQIPSRIPANKITAFVKYFLFYAHELIRQTKSSPCNAIKQESQLKNCMNHSKTIAGWSIKIEKNRLITASFFGRFESREAKSDFRFFHLIIA